MKINTTYFKLKERDIYGSSCVGVRNSDLDVLPMPDKNFSMTTVHYSIGSRTYELSNHLGNVLSVISDKVIPVFPYSNVISEMRADIRVAQDYSPFGVTLDGRNFVVSEGYRYGYQGSEKDDEVKGEGNSYITHFRLLDSRLGRWLSLDPVIHENQSPYCSFDNSPIFIKDPKGSEGEVANGDGPKDKDKVQKLTEKIRKARANNNQRRVDRLERKRDEILTGNRGELYPKENRGGRGRRSNFGKGGGEVPGDPPGNPVDCRIIFNPPSGIQVIGFRAAAIVPVGGVNTLQVFSIAVPAIGTGVPQWTATGLTQVTAVGGNVTGIVAGDNVVVDPGGNIMNPVSGGTALSALPGTDPNDTYLSAALDGVAADAIVRTYICTQGGVNFNCANDITRALLVPRVIIPIPFNCSR